MTDIIQVKVNITGRVQGVFYRASTRDAALRFKVNGYVRNMPDGSVEAVFQGSKASVEQILEWCKEGPAGAMVDKITQLDIETNLNFADFEVRY